MKEQQDTKKGILGSAIKRRWLVNNLSIVAASIAVIFVSVAMAITIYHYDSLKSSLVNRANSAAGYINRYMTESYNQFYSFTEDFIANYSDKDNVEVQIIDGYGRVMFSSTGLMAGYMPAAPDVTDCLSTQKQSIFVGLDELSGEKIASVTSPVVNKQGVLIGGVRFVSSTKLVQRQIQYVYIGLAIGAAFILLLIVVTSQFFISSIVNPVLKINELAKKIAKGQYGVKLNMEFDDEIGELCATLNNMSEEIANMEKLKNDFISSVSHELRTPLTAIGGWTETIAIDHSDKETMQQGLNIIHKETMRLSQMVEELLDFSRIESGRFRLQTAPFDIRGELYDAVFIYREALKEEGMAIVYAEPEEPVTINGDKHRIKQVFLNIIDNAAKYGADGDKIEITVEEEYGFAVIRIRDFGQGIQPNELPLVKQKFFKGSSKQRGAGIGLAVCNEIIDLHGGELNIESDYGEGTTVSIHLPLETHEETAI